MANTDSGTHLFQLVDVQHICDSEWSVANDLFWCYWKGIYKHIYWQCVKWQYSKLIRLYTHEDEVTMIAERYELALFEIVGLIKIWKNGSSGVDNKVWVCSWGLVHSATT